MSGLMTLKRVAGHAGPRDGGFPVLPTAKLTVDLKAPRRAEGCGRGARPGERRRERLAGSSWGIVVQGRRPGRERGDIVWVHSSGRGESPPGGRPPRPRRPCGSYIPSRSVCISELGLRLGEGAGHVWETVGMKISRHGLLTERMPLRARKLLRRDKQQLLPRDFPPSHRHREPSQTAVPDRRSEDSRTRAVVAASEGALQRAASNGYRRRCNSARQFVNRYIPVVF